jgi:hypothetical protein
MDINDITIHDLSLEGTSLDSVLNQATEIVANRIAAVSGKDLEELFFNADEESEEFKAKVRTLTVKAVEAYLGIPEVGRA